MHAPVAITPTCTNATPAIARVCANPHEGITRFCRVPRRAEKRSRRHIGGRERYDYGERECTLLSPKLFEGDRRCGAGNGGRCAGWMLIRKRCIRFRCLVRVDRCRRLVHRVDERGRRRGMRLWCGGRRPPPPPPLRRPPQPATTESSRFVPQPSPSFRLLRKMQSYDTTLSPVEPVLFPPEGHTEGISKKFQVFS